HLANNEPSHKDQIEKINPQKIQERKSEEEVELNDNDFDDEDKIMQHLQIQLTKIQFKIGDYKHFRVKWSRRTLESIGISQLVFPLVKPLDPKTPNAAFKLKQLKIDNRIVLSIEERQLSANTLVIILLPRMKLLGLNWISGARILTMAASSLTHYLDVGRKNQSNQESFQIVKYICSDHIIDRDSICIKLSMFVYPQIIFLNI
ncbi:hypothetical protein RFI_35752, partial [Reticulomyxa filosa]